MRLTHSQMKEVKKLTGCGYSTIDFVDEFADLINNLTVLHSTGYDFEEVDPADEIDGFRHRYLFEGTCEGLVNNDEEFDTLYYIICKIQDIIPHDLSKGCWFNLSLD